MKKIEAVIFDWAGTAVDFGCFAPVRAFQTAFASVGLAPAIDETRAPMGLPKRDHIAAMLAGKRLRQAFEERFGRGVSEEDIDEIYAAFEPALFATLMSYAQPIPGVLDAVERLRARDIRIGSTTGYTAAMMEIVTGAARGNGYAPDLLVCPDETGGVGRPYPYMIWKNLQTLRVRDVRSVVKVGDTAADIREGLNAGCISVGVLVGSSAMGLSEEEWNHLNAAQRHAQMEKARTTYREAGAHCVIERISDLPALIEQLEEEDEVA